MWIREELSDEQLADRMESWAYNREALMATLPHAKQRMEILSDFAPLMAYLVSGKLDLDEADFTANNQDVEAQLTLLQFALWRLEALRYWERDLIFAELKQLADFMGLKIRALLAPLFIAIAGSAASISVIDSMVLLGPDMSRARLRSAIDILGGVSKKKLKKLEKDYAALGRPAAEDSDA